VRLVEGRGQCIGCDPFPQHRPPRMTGSKWPGRSHR
jgi:hypothetical protein